MWQTLLPQIEGLLQVVLGDYIPFFLHVTGAFLLSLKVIIILLTHHDFIIDIILALVAFRLSTGAEIAASNIDGTHVRACQVACHT